MKRLGILVILILFMGMAAVQSNAKLPVINTNVTMEKSHLEPGICCEGGITLLNVKPGIEIHASFDVGNCGDGGSLLNWEIVDWPNWGDDWSFNPSIGNGLQKGEWKTISVSFKVPDGSGADYTGVIRVENTDPPNDYCTIDIHIITSRIRHLPCYHFLERFPILFSLLRYY